MGSLQPSDRELPQVPEVLLQPFRKPQLVPVRRKPAEPVVAWAQRYPVVRLELEFRIALFAEDVMGVRGVGPAADLALEPVSGPHFLRPFPEKLPVARLFSLFRLLHIISPTGFLLMRIRMYFTLPLTIGLA